MAQFGSFWSMLNFGHHSSRIDDMLNNPDTTLEQLLDDDNIISEFKGANSKLMEYCTDERIKDIMDYILVEPPEDADKARGYKYPFVACEILTADVQTIQSAFFGKNPNNILGKRDNDSSADGDDINSEDESEHQEKAKADPEVENKENEVVEENKSTNEPLEESKSESVNNTTQETTVVKEPVEDIATHFFKFLENKDLNVTLVGYFCRFLNHLVMRRYIEIGEYVWTHPHVIDLMINHIKFRNLAETLARLFTLENLSLSSTQTFIDLRIKKLAKIAEIFKQEVNETNEEVLSSAAYIICEVVNKKSTIQGGVEFENYFNTKEFLDIVFENLFKDDAYTANLINIINALLQMFLQAKTGNRNSDSDNPEAVEEVITGSDDENNLYDYLAGKIGDINEFLLGNQKDDQDTTYGVKQRPFGTTRLKLVETILYCVKLDVNKVSFEIGLKKIFSTLMELVTTYEWNNLLHNLVEKIFTATLESDSHVLKQKLLTQANLLDFLTNSTAEIQFTFPNEQKRQIRKGYLGQLTRIAAKVQKIAETDKEIKDYISNDKWKNFEEKYLRPTIQVETHDLVNSTKKESEDSEENMYHDDNYPPYNHRHDDNPEDLDDDNLEEREDEDSPKKEVHTNVDTLGEFEKGTEIWSKHAMTETNQHAHSDKNLWNQTFASFPFGINSGDLSEMDYNKFLEFNRQLDIIDMGPQHEERLEGKFIDNNYWAKNDAKTHNVDDLLKESEDF